MQKKLIDPEWNSPPKTLEEALGVIEAMRERLEEAEKIVNKPDYDAAKKLAEVEGKSETDKEKLDEVIASLKTTPLTLRGFRERGLYVIPYKNGKPARREKKLLTKNLKNKEELQKHCSKGTKPKTERWNITQFPKDLVDENRMWRFKPTKIEIIEV